MDKVNIKTLHALVAVVSIVAVAMVLAFYYPDADFVDEVKKKNVVSQVPTPAPSPAFNPAPVPVPVVDNEPETPPVDVTELGSANKNTYKDQTYGFELTFPAGWKKLHHPTTREGDTTEYRIYFNSQSTHQAYLNIMANRVYGEGYMDDVQVWVETLPTGMTLLDYVNRNSDAIPESVKAVTINGLRGYEADIGGFGMYYQVVLEKNGKAYTIFFGNSSGKEDLLLTESEILQSFKLR